MTSLDGKRRDSSTILVFCEEGRVKVCLSDREEGLVLFRSGRTLEEAVDALEACLVDGSADWRERKGGKR